MENTELLKELLEILLHVKIHHLEKKPVIGRSIQSGCSLRGIDMDVYLQDSNRVFDIEMQRNKYNYKNNTFRCSGHTQNRRL